MRGLYIFLKHKDYEIKREEFHLKDLLSRVENIEYEIDKLRKDYSLIKRRITEVKNGVEISITLNYANFILDEIGRKEAEKKKLLEKVQQHKQKLARLNGEKKAVEKYLEKRKRQELIDQLVQEGRLADEVFSRNFTLDSDNDGNG